MALLRCGREQPVLGSIETRCHRTGVTPIVCVVVMRFAFSIVLLGVVLCAPCAPIAYVVSTQLAPRLLAS